MDENVSEIDVPTKEPVEVLSDSIPAETLQVEATIVESEQNLAVPSTGSSTRKIEANRRNAQKSTGPKTSGGKVMSSWNSTRHGLLAKNFMHIRSQGKKQFARLLANLKQDLEPIGTLEEILLEKIAHEYWRLGVAAWHEEEVLTKKFPFVNSPMPTIMRYQTTINRELFQAINQLERLQRLRKGDNVPAPLSLQVLGDPRTTEDCD